MRSALPLIAVASGLAGVSLITGSAAAAPTPAGAGASAQPAAPPKKVCTVTDDRLRELSGLVATKTGYVVINDGADDASLERVFYLDARCKVTKSVAYGGSGPLDTEDLALSADGKTLWIADIGDNVTATRHRSTVALWSMPADGSAKPVVHRLGYPGQESRDAEALLMADDGTPVIVTKTIGKAQIFVPTGALKTNNTAPVPLKQVGELTLPRSTTENPLQAAGRVAITGAGRAPDGGRVVLRTYADAFEFDVSGGDIVGALTSGAPRMTPLADPFGEAVAYTPDGSRFITVSDAGTLGDSAEVSILSYPPVAATAPDETAVAAPETSDDAKSWSDKLTLQDITYLIAAVGLVGALLVGFGIYGIIRARRKPPGDGDQRIGRQVDPIEPVEPLLASVGGDGYDAYGDGGRSDYPGDGRGPRPGGGVYGGNPGGGGVYGGGHPGGGGGVYGGRPGGPGGGGGGGYGGPPAGGGGYGGGPAGGPPGGGGGVYGGGGGYPGGGGYGGDGRPPGNGPGNGRAGNGRQGSPPRPDQDRGGPYGPQGHPGGQGGYRDEGYR